MKLNKELLEQIRSSHWGLLAVTKYWDNEQTQNIFAQLREKYSDIFVWIWENRAEVLKWKDIDRDRMHFIGNVQTKKIKDIVKYCEVIHSVDNIKHIRKMEEICTKSDTWVQIFIQINVDPSKKGGINPSQIPEFLEVIGELENVSLVWFSAIGKSDCTRIEKEEEFDLLCELRNKYLPNGMISAWTSRDYEIALEKWVDIVRIWQALII